MTGLASARSRTAPRVAVVTGASRGLGRRVVERLAGGGYAVVSCATGPTPPGVGEALHLAVDVTDPEAVDRLVRGAVDRFGRLDLLVNNAGYANPPAPLSETADAIAQRCFATNVLGPYATMRRALPVMVRQPDGGVVVNVASRAGLVPVPRLAAYSASKSALVSLTLAIAKELDGTPVVAFSVCPGGMDTEMRRAVYGADDAREQQAPDRVAEVVVELATRRTLRGQPAPSGAAIVVAQGSEPAVVEWPRDSRGHSRFTLG